MWSLSHAYDFPYISDIIIGMKNIDILHEDSDILIVNKPAGLAVQGGKGVKTSLDNILAGYCTPAPLLIHRLDKDTSGVLLTAKGREAASYYSRVLNENAQKIYIAICKGSPKKKEGVIKEALDVHGRLKNAETTYRVVKTGIFTGSEHCLDEFSVLEIELRTGRMHQIRRHLAIIGNPILGDDKYGDFTLNKCLKKSIKLKRVLLHASRLIINKKLNIIAPLPQFFNKFNNGNLTNDT
jgi:23S rRNA pseudouridine955/2504/2580 synthase